MPKKLKVGLIGVGGIARLHMPGWQDNPHADLVALADPNAKVLKEKGNEWNVARAYERPEDLLADKDIDAVDLCVPNVFHAPLTIAALEAGKHVLCEKPLAPTPAEIATMIAARDRSGKILMTAQHFRFTPTAQALKREIDAGLLGDVYHARGWMLRRNATPCNTNFTLKKNSGGGPCIDIGVHILDLTLWMMGHPKPVAVSGVAHAPLHQEPSSFSIWGGKLPAEWDVEEFAAAQVRFANGASLILETSWLLHHKIPPAEYEDMQLWLYGTRGGAHWPSDEILRSDGASQQTIDARLEVEKDPLPPHARECVAFADAIVNRRPSPVPAEQSLDLMSILQGLYRSAAEGREVRLDPH